VATTTPTPTTPVSDDEARMRAFQITGNTAVFTNDWHQVLQTAAASWASTPAPTTAPAA
jgi:predicted nuclease of restriction endonuclease-like RecB superfamily